MQKVALLLTLLFLLVGFSRGGPEDKVVFLDVGQGDAILFQNGTRQVLTCGTQNDCLKYG